jgi:hypothetical protein
VLTRRLAPPPVLLGSCYCYNYLYPRRARPSLRARNASTGTRDPIRSAPAIHPWRLGFGSPPSSSPSSSPPPPSPPEVTAYRRFSPSLSLPATQIRHGGGASSREFRARSVRAASPARGNGADRARLGCGGLGLGACSVGG